VGRKKRRRRDFLAVLELDHRKAVEARLIDTAEGTNRQEGLLYPRSPNRRRGKKKKG